MATAVVGGAFLSAFLQVIFDRLSSPRVANLIRGKKLDSKLIQKLKTTLYAVGAVLNDAEQKQINDPNVKMWLDDLKDAVYVADDLLDEVSTQAAIQKEVSNLFSGYPHLEDREMVDNLEDITDRLESILKLKDSLGLEKTARENFSWRTPSTSLVEESKIHGRDLDKEVIIKLLFDDNNDDKISVIPIVGMGGVGKTTLAQLVYNDDILMQKFDLKAWVCVSEEFDILKVTKTIIEAVTSSTCNLKDLNLLQLDLKKKLTGKKFFVVLDDVWNDNYDAWNILQKLFQYGIKGSKILITSRSKKIASIVQTFPAYHLNQLSDEDCWLVFTNHACLSLESKKNSNLERIGREIVKRCKGLPLAAQTLGGLLRAKRDIKDWNTILKCGIWELSENESKIIPALRISYHYLPPHLKRCFVYCSLYPQDYVFQKDELILLWMAEDLLQPTKRGKALEDVGYEYFDDLVSRSFFKCVNTEGIDFVMHDLVHDLATFIAGEFYLRSEELQNVEDISIMTRHLSYSTFSHPISESFEAFDRIKSLRTLLPINLKRVSFSLENAAPMVLSKFQYLRVLSFRDFQDLDNLPHSIGEMIHLRYLDLSKTCIETLPESLCNLYNLQTLKLVSCYNLTMLPSNIQNLVNLRHLHTYGTFLNAMPKGMGKLEHLQFLSKYVVGKDEENGIKQMGGLANLHGPLVIAKLENVGNSGEALEAKMVNKKHIQKLCLQWSRDDDFTDSTIEKDILDKLEPHKGLKILTIRCYRGTRFPNWVGNSSYHNMTELVLQSCQNCCMLPSLGQLPSLKSLRIQDFNGLESIGSEFYKNDDGYSSSTTPFVSLEYLAFQDMSSWEVWHSFEFDAFPQLKELRISNCARLTGVLPNHLPALEKLYILGCGQLASSLPIAPTIRQLDIYECNKVVLPELPLSLHSFSIKGSQLVESMFEAITNTQPTCLQTLYISSCSSANAFPRGGIPASVKILEIRDCKKLEFPKQQQHDSLDSLVIHNSCESLASFPLETFPNLKSLSISKCENLESLSVSQLQDVALRDLIIHGCPKIEWYPREELAAPSMTIFEVSECDNLKSLPFHMNALLPKLKELRIKHCPEIDSFPEGGLPPNLTTLVITNCNKLLNGLASMARHGGSLTNLSIYGPCESVKSFPMEGLLPQLASLTSLYLYGLSNLETLDCKGLVHLSSLQQLSISKCPKLENMAGERLPASLILLDIFDCPLLEERCLVKHPHIWPKIFHIPGIRVSDKSIS